MPLQKGKGKQVIDQNIAEVMRSYKQKGSIGHTRPGSTRKAQQIAAAIAYRMQGKS